MKNAEVLKYTLLQQLRYLSNYSRLVIHLQRTLDSLDEPALPEGMTIREMDPENPAELDRWIRIIRDAYLEPQLDRAKALLHFKNHLFLTELRTFFLLENSEAIGTITIGKYRQNPHTGGDARVALLNAHRNKGLGRLLVHYGFYQLRQTGINQAESIITITRTPSIRLHFQLGFKPLFNRSQSSYRQQRRFWMIRLVANFKVLSLYLSKRQTSNGK